MRIQQVRCPSAKVLIGIITVFFVHSMLVPDAYSKRKKRRHKKADVEAVEAAPAESPQDEVMMASDEASDEAEAPVESKSISSQLNGGGDSDGGMRRSSRMEFDERLVKGQAAKSGAVYLFKRVPRHLPGLVPMRRSYRDRIVQPILGDRVLKPARYSFEVEEALKAQKRKMIQEAPKTKSEIEATPKRVEETKPTEPESNAEERPKNKKRKKRK